MIISRLVQNILNIQLKGTEDQVFSLIHNCLRSGATVDQLIIEVIFPAIEEIQKLYDDGKIGTSELKLLQNIISKSPTYFNQQPVVSNTKKNVVVISADSKSLLISETASAAYHSDGWRVSHLG